ncbi:hypothetical protein KR026_011343, partial [Drosophila bipectinata]
IEKKTLKHALSLCAFHFVSMAMSMAMSPSMCLCGVYGCMGVNKDMCEYQDTGVCSGCVVCYQLRFMQICLAAEPSRAVDFFVNSFCSVVLPFVLLSSTTSTLPSTHSLTKQIKLFACASK